MELSGAIYKAVPADLRWHFHRWMRTKISSWTPGGEGWRWRECKVFIGWTRYFRAQGFKQCSFVSMLLQAVTTFEFDATRKDALVKLATRLLKAFHMLASSRYTANQHGQFVQLVSGLCNLWKAVFGTDAPVSCHILEFHWPGWLELVKAHSCRTEGGERCNGPHSKIYRSPIPSACMFHYVMPFSTNKQSTGECTSCYARTFNTPSENGISRTGADGLLCVDVGPWWVVQRGLAGRWPNL